MYRNKTDYSELSQRLGYQFNQPALLIQALTRPSALNERLYVASSPSFQRLEFIGDKVLNLIISDILMEQYPDWQEGRLTQEVAEFVNNKGPLATIARRLGIGSYLIMGKGEEITNQARTNEKVLSDAIEALLGAIWLDSQHDYQRLRQVISRHWKALGLPVNSPCTKDISTEEITSGSIPVNPTKTDITDELNAIFWQLDTESEIFDYFQQWLARQTTSLPLMIAASNYLFEENSEERTDYLKLVLEKHLLSQTELDRLLVDSFNLHGDTAEKFSYIKLLLQYGANPNITTDKHQALLSAIIEYECSAKSIELLLSYGAEVNWHPGKKKLGLKSFDYPTKNKEENTRASFFKLAKTEPASINAGVADLNTALHTLAGLYYFTDDHFEITQLLLRYQADPNLPNQAGQTPLHLACASLFPSQAELSPFHSNEYDPVAKILLIYDLLDDADVNQPDNQGNTPLHLLLKKWRSLSEPVRRSYSIESSSGITETVSLFSTRIFLEFINTMLAAKGELHLTNQAGESAIDLASVIILPPQELAVIANNSDLFLQPLEFDNTSYSVAELIPRLIGYSLGDAKPSLK